ncbi:MULTISPECIES: NUDIX domain-containing protein [unclassified Mycobacterium]|uniref:NUDIX domain-containing protein n=1 Tax=unclassified Mycobacterium TaxID=2642494 RepID=UPI0004919FED|nr:MULTISPECIES: NUDIX domain-containing protein [unclassified Mycobacterium]
MRVAAYVLRRRHSWELLVFEQAACAQAGRQIPAGGVHFDETTEEAVLREVHEEAGLPGLRLREQLVTEDRPHPLTGQPRRTTYFTIDVDSATPDEWEHVVRGDDADDGLIVICRFVPLPLSQSLADHQDAWLELIDKRFATTRARDTND